MRTRPAGCRDRALVAASLVLASLGVPSTSIAQVSDRASPAQETEKTPLPKKDSRQLGPHKFVFPALQPAAFVVTSASVQQGLSDRVTPRVPAALIGEVDVRTLVIVDDLRVSVKITDWLGVSVVGAGTFATAVNIGSLALGAVEYTLGAGGGVSLRIAHIEATHTQLVLHGNALYEGGRFVTLRPFVGAVLKDPLGAFMQVITGQTANLLLVPASGYQVGGALALAQPFGRWAGAQLSAGFTHQHTTVNAYDAGTRRPQDVSIFTTTPTVGMALDLDGSPAGVPFVIMGETVLAFPNVVNRLTNQRVDRLEPTFAVGLYYAETGRLQLGLVGSMTLGLEPLLGIGPGVEGERSERGQATTGRIVLRQVW